MSALSPVTNVLYTAVSWVLLRWHQLFTALGMDRDGGITWALSVIFLVITARLLLFRFFIKQVHYTRHMQVMQPQIAKIKEKYKGDRQAQTKAMTELQQEQGFSPLAGCAPMLLQVPIFISLFHVLRHLARSASTRASDHQLTLYGFSKTETISAAHARLFGHAPLSVSLRSPSSTVAALDGHVGTVRVVALILALVSAGATLITQRQSMRNATVAPTGQQATIQRLMMYFIPASVLFSGIIFPIGVLLYWFTSNLWTMGQQFYIYRFHPVNPVAPMTAVISETSRNLAPAPGAKPVRPQTRKAAPAEPVTAEAAPTGGATAARTSTPRPGSRPGGARSTRPNSKRPSQPRSKRR